MNLKVFTNKRNIFNSFVNWINYNVAYIFRHVILPEIFKNFGNLQKMFRKIIFINLVILVRHLRVI